MNLQSIFLPPSDFFKRDNCDQVQGFLFCRPLPPDEFIEMLHKKYCEMLKKYV